MANRNKNKGKRGEVEFVKVLNDTFGLNFQRVPNSGAFLGGKNVCRYDEMTDSQKLLHDGDIIVPNELKNFSIECKNYNNLSFHQLFFGKCSQLDTWIKQASHTKKTFWLLFIKITRKGTFVCYPKTYKFDKSDNYFIYKNKFCIEDVKIFLEKNKIKILNKNE
jgi:Holliday junction resolvase